MDDSATPFISGGSFLADGEGRRLLDCWCGGGAFALGHRPPAVLRALSENLGRRDIGNHHLVSGPKGLLGRRLAEILPGSLNRAVFNVSQGEAVDLAVKLARGFTGRLKVVSVAGSAHGGTGFALAASDPAFSRGVSGPAPGFVAVPAGDGETLARALDRGAAAFLCEPSRLASGLRPLSREYLALARRLCDRAGALLISDESHTGLWRTGKVLACLGPGFSPDIVVVGRALSGGVYPVHATCYRDRLDRFFQKNPFIHISTFGGSDLGCFTALAALGELAGPALAANVAARGKQLAGILARAREGSASMVVETRVFGLLGALETRREADGRRLAEGLRARGVFCLTAALDPRTVLVVPPLNVAEGELGLLSAALDGSGPGGRHE